MFEKNENMNKIDNGDNLIIGGFEFTSPKRNVDLENEMLAHVKNVSVASN